MAKRSGAYLAPRRCVPYEARGHTAYVDLDGVTLGGNVATLHPALHVPDQVFHGCTTGEAVGAPDVVGQEL